MKERWIFFDAVGTLFHVRGSIGGQYARAARRFGARPSEVRLERTFRLHFSRMPSMASAAEGAKPGWEFEWWKNLVRGVFDDAGIRLDFDACFDHIFGIFATAACWDLFPESLATLKLLGQRGWSVGIISNFDSRLIPLLSELGLQACIRQTTLSFSAGAAKPEARIFLEACRQGGIAPEHAWHVGDSIMDDYEGARRAGLNAILLDRGWRHDDFDGPRIRRLSQLCARPEF